MQPVTHRVQPECGSVRLGGDQRVREEPRQHGPAARREGARVVHDLVGRVVQDAQRRVQVVVARIDQVEADHRPSEELLRLVVRERTRPEAAPRQDVRGRHREVALALVDVDGLMDLGEAVAAEPVAVGGRLREPFLVREAGPQHPAVDDGGPVGGEDHVRQFRVGCEQLDGVAEGAVAAQQVLPLGLGQREVDGLGGVHPRVDGVRHPEVRRGAHQVAAGCGFTRQ